MNHGSLVFFQSVGCSAILTDQMMKNRPNLQSIRELGKAKGSWAAWHLQGGIIKSVIENAGRTFFISFIVWITHAEISINVFVEPILSGLFCLHLM